MDVSAERVPAVDLEVIRDLQLQNATRLRTLFFRVNDTSVDRPEHT